MAEDTGDKTLDPTPHRRQRARDEGQVAKSQDLASAVLLFGGLVIVLMMGGGVIGWLFQLTRSHLGGAPWLEVDVAQVVDYWNLVQHTLVRRLLPLLAVMLLLTVLANLVQIGPMFVPQKLAPDLSRLDPLQGTRRLFSLPSLMRLVFGIFKVLVILAVAAASLWADRKGLMSLTGQTVPEIAWYIGQTLVWTALKIALALLMLAVLDFAFQRWKFERDLKMTPQEMREEMRNLHGDPQVIARRRAVQRQLVVNRLNTSVPTADVVVTNPTELAVAIKYAPETMAAPIVVAKGAGVLAGRIRKLALENGIPIVERKPLAQALYRDVDLGKPVPHQQYAAVAEVLAYVYRLKGKSVPKNLAA